MPTSKLFGINKMKDFTLEICIDSVESAIIAQANGADRVELCANLLEGGTTPSCGMIMGTRAMIDIKLAVMIRPRGGDFCYSDLEFAIMKQDIAIAKSMGASCLVFGVLLPNGSIDVVRTKELVELAKPLETTFHRAFDHAYDPFQALEDVISTGVDRLLTSGQQQKAIEGKELIKELVIVANNRISIMPGSGVNLSNRDELLNYTKATELHITALTHKDGEMFFKPSYIPMSSTKKITDFQLNIANPNIIHDMKKKKSIR